MQKLCLLLAFLACGTAIVRGETSVSNDVPNPVLIEYFYEPGCPECLVVAKEIMPELKKRFQGKYCLAECDFGVQTNYLRLMAYQNQSAITKDEPVSMVVDGIYFLNGLKEIRQDLFNRVGTCILARQRPDWKPAAPPKVAGVESAKEKMKTFTLSIVIVNGLLDGINPCAISILVFFMSLLGVSRIRGSGMLIMGLFFCLATFLTYTALGFGVLRALHLLTGFENVRMVVEAAMMGLLGVFAYLSFRDAYRYSRSGKSGDVSLQLPDGIKAKIHGIMREGISPPTPDYGGSSLRYEESGDSRQRIEFRFQWIRLAIGGFVIGAAVTALESVCTGQVYVPTLVMVAKEGGELSGRALRYVLLYNAMFLVPLVTVFVLTYCGLRTATFLEWSKRNVVVSKILLGLFFLVMAVLIAVV